LFGHDLIIPKNFKQKQKKILKLFRYKNPEGRFILSPRAEMVGFSIFNKYEKHKNVEEISQFRA
jgi:hypothetical protein